MVDLGLPYLGPEIIENNLESNIVGNEDQIDAFEVISNTKNVKKLLIIIIALKQ